MSRVRWEAEGRDWPNRAASRFVETARVRWHVQVMGSGPVLLLLHGTGAATHSWRDLAPLLAEHFTVIAPDLPGHGFTTGRPRGGLSLPAMARALGELLAALKLAPDSVVGHSAGVAIGLRMALDGIVAPQALVGLNAALMPFPGLAARVFPALARALFVNPFAPHMLAQMARNGDPARFLVRATGSRIDAAGVDFYARLFRTTEQCSGAITMMADWDLESLKRDLPQVTTPLLLLHGEADSAIPIATARDAAALMRDARLESLPALGHLAHEERPAEVAAMIRDFVEKR